MISAENIVLESHRSINSVTSTTIFSQIINEIVVLNKRWNIRIKSTTGLSYIINEIVVFNKNRII